MPSFFKAKSSVKIDTLLPKAFCQTLLDDIAVNYHPGQKYFNVLVPEEQILADNLASYFEDKANKDYMTEADYISLFRNLDGEKTIKVESTLPLEDLTRCIVIAETRLNEHYRLDKEKDERPSRS